MSAGFRFAFAFQTTNFANNRLEGNTYEKHLIMRAIVISIRSIEIWKIYPFATIVVRLATQMRTSYIDPGIEWTCH